jgi:hypothetical protein
LDGAAGFDPGTFDHWNGRSEYFKAIFIESNSPQRSAAHEHQVTCGQHMARRSWEERTPLPGC